MTPIAPHITAYLRERLAVERRASPNTCDTYSYAFQLLFEFMAQKLGTTPSNLQLEHLDAPLVLEFLPLCGALHNGRLSVTQAPEAVFSQFDLLASDPWPPRYNVSPGQDVLAVTGADNDRQLLKLHWGFLPRWAANTAGAKKLINARSETVGDKPSFKVAFAHGRCVLVADGFYEWLRAKDGSVPIYFRFTQPLAVAALWEGCAVDGNRAAWLLRGHDRSEQRRCEDTRPNARVARCLGNRPMVRERRNCREVTDAAPPKPGCVAARVRSVTRGEQSPK